MQHEAALLRDLPLSVADAPAAGDQWTKSPLSGLSDAALIDAVGAAIARPKRDADSSFLTHAPLELAARAALLPMAAPEARDRVRRRIAAIAARYAREGEEVEDAPGDHPDERAALRSLLGALKEGDADDVDAALVWLAPRASVLALRRALAEEIAPMLGAAAHAPILLAELPRLEARISSATGLLRAPLRYIAKMADARLAWHERAAGEPVDGEAASALFDRLASAPTVRSASVYIAPTMLAVEAAGFAERMLADAASAPYGWTHALTIRADRHGGRRLSCAKGSAISGPCSQRVRRRMATRILQNTRLPHSMRRRDPEAARLYLAAAAYLGAWRDRNPEAAFE